MSGLGVFETKKLRIFKFDERAEMKNFYFSHGKAILVMGGNLEKAFLISFEGFRKKKAAIVAPGNEFSSMYIESAPHALVKNALFIFEGNWDKKRVKKFRILRINESRSRNWKAASGRNNRLD